ncbi:MAG: endonuclease III [Candidatus Aenigmarchaeota archaeon]|nr:endonuclease III [Candidatus Aenigmarchaeota archaeon]
MNHSKVLKIIQVLEKEYKTPVIFLEFSNPLETLVATILSAQCTDARVNIVTKDLFRKYRTVRDYAKADIKEFERDIHSTGFYHNKAKNIINAAKMIISDFGGKVPDTMDGLLHLPGVARKTANIVLSHGFGKIDGIAVDTHVSRLSQRIGLSENKDPDKIERDLMLSIPKEHWYKINYILIMHGRKICNARKPKCEECVIRELCPRIGVK